MEKTKLPAFLYKIGEARRCEKKHMRRQMPRPTSALTRRYYRVFQGALIEHSEQSPQGALPLLEQGDVLFLTAPQAQIHRSCGPGQGRRRSCLKHASPLCSRLQGNITSGPGLGTETFTLILKTIFPHPGCLVSHP